MEQVNLVNKANFCKKLISFYRWITSKKAKYLEVKKKQQQQKKKRNSLITKDYNFFFGGIYFTSSDESQNTFIYQTTLDTLELKKDRGTDCVFSLKSKGVHSSKLKPLYNAFLICRKISEYRIGIKFDNVSLAIERNNY